MDSGNSDSFQSSNGGDEEYNSHDGDTISEFINPAVGGIGSFIYTPSPHQSTNPPMFDPIISNYQNLQSSMLLNNNLDLVWSKALRSPNRTETSNQLSSQQLFIIQNSNLPSSSPPVPEIMNTNSSTSSLPLSDHRQTHVAPSVRNPNPKKRSRASRRAPTTVLATDTTNFRAMVQEFTGIPEPPFTSPSSSLFSRNSRLDHLFGTSSSMRSNPLDYSISLSSQPPPYVSRPFPQKVQPPLSASSMFGASMVDSLRTKVDDSYQCLQSSNLFTMQNPVLASLLQSNPPKTNFSDNLSILESKTHHGSMQIQAPNGALNEFGGLGQGLVDNNGSLDALPGLVSSYPRRRGVGAGADQVRWSGNNNGGSVELSRNVGNGKRLKEMMEDVAVGARSEGMMETWICSSSE